MHTKLSFLLALICFTISACHTGSDSQTVNSDISITTHNDPLPSWKDGALKYSIIRYVNEVTDPSGNQFIPEEDRIATFDNDGTLWAERPFVQELFAVYRAKKMTEENPSLAGKQPYKAILNSDKNYFEKGGVKAALELISVTHTGMTPDQFEASVGAFMATNTYPGMEIPMRDIVYLPQLELLNYLRDHGFKTYIVTGGTVDFVRVIAPQLYGIPKEQVIGSSFEYEFIDSSAKVMSKSTLGFLNDKEAKPVAIQLHIGKQPVFACGNEGAGGDIAMLKFSQAGQYPSFQLLINHDDPSREFAYQEKDSASLKAAQQYNWHVVSIQNDWERIFPSNAGQAHVSSLDTVSKK